jgi:hypothetical protein
MKSQKKPPEKLKTFRCAIYTRKSTEEGLEQEFNTLDAQRYSGENYIRSQEHEGWICLPELYDDGGFTGANMDRPGPYNSTTESKDTQQNTLPTGRSRHEAISTI